MSAWVAVVPARGGSVGIPGKNRRPVGGISLVHRAILRALAITDHDPTRVVVTTDDEFVEDVAEAFGCRIVRRPDTLAGGAATIADTVHHAIESTGHIGCPVAVCQPTSPTLTADTAQRIAAEFDAHPEWTSLATVTDNTHLSWYEAPDGRLAPMYADRVNRQQRTDHIWQETGGLMLVRAWHGPDDIVSEQHHLMPIDDDEGIDVDTPADLFTADHLLRRSVVEWRIVAGQTVGYGHLYRSLAIAAEMPHHDHRWIVDGPDEARIIVGNRYPVAPYGAVYETAADVIVFDCLDVAAVDYDRARYDDGALVVGIELQSLPPHAMVDLYVDELASGMADTQFADRAGIVRVGPPYASIRDEFRAARLMLDTGAVTRYQRDGSVLVTFGGEDPHGFTERVLDALERLTDAHDIRAVIGPGFATTYANRLRDRWPRQIIEAGSARMARLMLSHPVVITSTGRTVWEAAMLGCSIVTIPVNERERAHAYPHHARRLPGYDADPGTIRLLTEAALMFDEHTVDARRERARTSDVDGLGPRRIAWLVDGMLGDLA